MTIYAFLDYHKKTIKVELVNRCNDVKLVVMTQKKKDYSTQKEARQIVDKRWSFEVIEADNSAKVKDFRAIIFILSQTKFAGFLGSATVF